MIRLNLDDGFKENIRRILELSAKTAQMVIELNAGGSGSGKSTDTKRIEIELNRQGISVVVISADNYYIGGKKVREMGIDFDDPRAINLELLRKDILLLRDGHPIMEKMYTFGEEPAKETGKKIYPPKILIVEGLFVLRDEIRDLGDIKIFYDIGLHGWLLRRIFRDPERTGMRPANILSYCTNVVEPKYKQWILSTRKFADIIIENEYNPRIEAKNTGRFEYQIKFKVIAREDDLIHRLLKLGADRLSFTEQIDTYYNPKDRDLRLTGESMRVRYESGKIIWTYKGPANKKNSIAVRSKYEFEISREIMEIFLSLYGSEMKVIKKIRTMFFIELLVITVDNVAKIENGIKENLGIFLEFRMNGRKINQEKMEKKIEKIIKKLDLGSAQAETRSYVEM